MNVDTVEQLAHRLVAAFNDRDFDALDDIFWPDYHRRTPPGFDDARGIERLKADLEERARQYGNARFELHDVVATDDAMAVHFSVVGEHTKSIHGERPTGRLVRRHTMAFFQIRDGRIQGSFMLSDADGLRRQLAGELDAGAE